MDEQAEPIRPHHSNLLVTLLLGTGATVEVADLDGNGFPSLAIVHAAQGIGLHIEPFGPSEGALVSACDVQRGKELAEAAQSYYEMLRAAYERLQSGAREAAPS